MFWVNEPFSQGFPDNLAAKFVGHFETILTFSCRSNETSALSFLAQSRLEVSVYTRGPLLIGIQHIFHHFIVPLPLTIEARCKMKNLHLKGK